MTDAELREARLIRAAKRILGDTSDEVWCDNDDDPRDDAKLLARNVLASGRADDGEFLSSEWLNSVGFVIDWTGNCTLATITIEDFDGTSGDAHVDLRLNQELNSREGEWLTDVISYGDDGTEEAAVGLVKSWCKTRGDVRNLCSALGVSLREGGAE